jgi:hypothetical protein
MEPLIIIAAASLAIGFVTGYGARSVVSRRRRTRSRKRSAVTPPARFQPPKNGS